jgi:hypothetical protein
LTSSEVDLWLNHEQSLVAGRLLSLLPARQSQTAISFKVEIKDQSLPFKYVTKTKLLSDWSQVQFALDPEPLINVKCTFDDAGKQLAETLYKDDLITKVQNTKAALIYG